MCNALGQDNAISIELGESTLIRERPFTISVIIRNSETRPVLDFPEIPGLSKRGTNTSTTSTMLNGKAVVSQVITQNYVAQRPGQYKLAPFTLQVNGTTVRSEGTTITVAPEAGAPVSTSVATAVVTKRDAFLTLTTSSGSVFTGEGFTVKLAFFVAETYPFELSFFELESQLQQILKQLRPANCWEENSGISELKPHLTVLNGKRYTEYRIYQATFFPLNQQPIRFAPVSLRMEQIRPATVGKRPREFVAFSTAPQSVGVRPLPPHPLRDRVAVGQYRLQEYISRTSPATGESVQYDFRIEGEGNIASLPQPILPSQPGFDIFPPEEKQEIERQEAPVTGYKRFRYLLVARQNGAVPLGRIFQYIFFNPQKARYDTLRSAITLRVGGAAADGETDTVQVGLPGSIYTGIEKTDSLRQPINPHELIRVLANVSIVIMILGMLYLLWKK
nr:BatD family protein [Tellurirhabdus rosea]